MSLILATICLVGNVFSCQPAEVRVIDGDTIQIKRERIRLVGIDAPEIKGACAAEVDTAFKAKHRLAQLIADSNVVLERTGRDKYQRTLAHVSVDGIDLGDALMSEGLARKWEKKWSPGLDDVWCANALERQ